MTFGPEIRIRLTLTYSRTENICVSLPPIHLLTYQKLSNLGFDPNAEVHLERARPSHRLVEKFRLELPCGEIGFRPAGLERPAVGFPCRFRTWRWTEKASAT